MGDFTIALFVFLGFYAIKVRLQLYFVSKKYQLQLRQMDMKHQEKIRFLEEEHQSAISNTINRHNSMVTTLNGVIDKLKSDINADLKARKAEKERNFHKWKFSNIKDVNNQIYFVKTARFGTNKLMNVSEFIVFSALETWLLRYGRGYRLFSQVPLGVYLKTNSDNARASINSKRCDFLVIDRYGNPVIVFEYQGEGHYQGDAKERDIVKKIAHDKAGVPVQYIFPRDSAIQIQTFLAEAIGNDSEQILE